jgi:hypothetical protein
MKLRVYLAGWSQELEYREIVKKYCKDCLDLVNPMDITWPEVNMDVGENCAFYYIVRRDKMLIETCHVLVAYVRVGPTWGTTMEIIYAHDHGIPVFVIDPTPGFKYASDAWCRFHTTKLFSSIEDCFDFLMNKDVKKSPETKAN